MSKVKRLKKRVHDLEIIVAQQAKFSHSDSSSLWDEVRDLRSQILLITSVVKSSLHTSDENSVSPMPDSLAIKLLNIVEDNYL